MRTYKLVFKLDRPFNGLMSTVMEIQASEWSAAYELAQGLCSTMNPVQDMNHVTNEVEECYWEADIVTDEV